MRKHIYDALFYTFAFAYVYYYTADRADMLLTVIVTLCGIGLVNALYTALAMLGYALLYVWNKFSR